MRRVGLGWVWTLSMQRARQDLEMAELVERVRGAAVAHAARLLRAEPGAAVDYLVVDLPCTFFMLRASRCSRPRSKRITHTS